MGGVVTGEFTRIDGHQIARSAAATRVHPTQVDRSYAVRLDRARDKYHATYGIIPRANGLAATIEVPSLTYEAIETAWDASITPFLSQPGPVTIVVAPAQSREDTGGTRITWRQVMGYMEPMAFRLFG